MKPFFLTLLSLTLLTAHADTRSAQIIGRMGAVINGWKSYAVDFVLDASGQEVAGRWIVSGENYYLQVEGTQVYCDGRTRWEVNASDREVTIDRVDERDKSILSNPTQVFAFSDDAFTHSYAGARNGLEVIALRPRQGGNIVEIRLSAHPATGLPAAIEYRLDQASEPVSIRVVSIRPEPAVPASRFLFDRTKYKGYEVIDFR